MEGSSKLKTDFELGKEQREQIVQTYLNPYIAQKYPIGGHRFIFTHSGAVKGLEYHFRHVIKENPIIPIHFRNSHSEVYLKMPSKKIDPYNFLCLQSNAYFVFYEVHNDSIPTGRFHQMPVKIGELMKDCKWSVGGSGNQNRIIFTGFGMSVLSYTFLGEAKGFFQTDLLEELVKAWRRLVI